MRLPVFPVHVRTWLHTTLSVSAVLILAGFMAFSPGGQSARAAATVQGIAVPMYEYPTIGTFWDDITGAGGSGVPFVVVNPASGPGAAVDSIYTAEIAENTTDGIRSIGYVNTSYQTRPFQEAYDDIDKFYELYPGISGIFIDLITEGTTADVCYVAALYNHVKNRHPNDLVVINPGTHISDSYEPYSDIFMNAENTYAALQSGWSIQYPGFEDNPAYTNRFWHVSHTTSAANYAAARDMLRANNAGWIYITDDVMPNPYRVTPSYWATELSDAASLGGTQTIPNRGKTQLPAACRDLSTVSVNTVSTGTKKVTTSSVITTSNNGSFAVEGQTRISFSLPSGVTMASASGTGWNCNTTTKLCNYDNDIAASGNAIVNASFEAGCSYSSGTVTGTITNFSGNAWTLTLPLTKPNDCTVTPVSTDTPPPSSSSTQQPPSGSKPAGVIPDSKTTAAPAEEVIITESVPEPIDNKSNNPLLKQDTAKNDSPDDTVEATSSLSPAKLAVGLVFVIVIVGCVVWLCILYVRRRQPIKWQ